MFRAAYQFFDAGFIIESDTAEFIENFDQVYRRFRVVVDENFLVYRLLLLQNPPTLTINSQTRSTCNPADLEQYAYSTILNAATARVRSHFLFHGGALYAEKNDSGYILTGLAAMGKTTLTMALIKHGFRFLGDDIAAIGRDDHRLYPFPRSLGLRMPNRMHHAKQWIDIEEVDPRGPAGICTPQFLIVLSDPDSPKASLPENRTCYYARPDMLTRAWLQEVREIAGLLSADVLTDGQYPVVRLEMEPGMLPKIETAIEVICQKHHILLYDLSSQPETHPGFDQKPSLIPIAPSEAAIQLLAGYKGGPRSHVLQVDYKGNTASLYMDLVKITSKMHCYRLSVGYLDDMLNFIIQLGDTNEH